MRYSELAMQIRRSKHPLNKSNISSSHSLCQVPRTARRIKMRTCTDGVLIVSVTVRTLDKSNMALATKGKKMINALIC
jgi:hypothetical protein